MFTSIGNFVSEYTSAETLGILLYFCFTITLIEECCMPTQLHNIKKV